MASKHSILSIQSAWTSNVNGDELSLPTIGVTHVYPEGFNFFLANTHK